MKTKILLLILVVACKLLHSQSIYPSWSKQFNGKNINPFFITTDPAGNVFTSGYMNDTADFDPGPGLYQLTSQNSEAYITKQAANGDLKWAVKLTNTSNARYDLKADALGNVYSLGLFFGVCDFDPGAGTYTLSSAGITPGFPQYVWKLDANGAFVYAKKVTNNVTLWSSMPDASGNLYICGSFSGNVDFDFGTGTNSITSQGVSDGFICKLDPLGNLVYVKQFESGSVGGIKSISFGNNSEIIAIGTFSNSIDADPGSGTNSLSGTGTMYFTTKLDMSGNFISAVAFPLPAGLNAFSEVINDPIGNIYTCGTFTGVCDFDPSSSTYTLQSLIPTIFLCKLYASGNFNWVKTIEIPYFYNTYLNLQMDGGNNLYLVGSSNGTLDCDPGPGTSTLGAGHFMTILNSAGNFLESTNLPGLVTSIDSPGNIYCSWAHYSVSSTVEKFGSVLTGLTSQSKNGIQLRVFPNPANGLFTLVSESSKSFNSVEIYDLFGQKILDQKMEATEISVDLRTFSSGIYLLKVLNQGALVGQTRLVKE